MIAAGEAGGILDTILKRLATYIEKAVKLRAPGKGAMIYPIVVLSLAVLALAIIMWEVIPGIGRASWGGRGEISVGARLLKKKKRQRLLCVS